MLIDISIVIPTYRRPALLFRCLSALYRQDMDPERYEIIVVTDGPDPVTIRVLQTLLPAGPRTRCLSLDEKKGPAAARNLGWRMASGALVLFTDDDCVPVSHWVSAYWDAFHTYRGESRLDGIFGEYLAFRGPVYVPCPPRPTDYEKNTAGLQAAAFVTANCACTGVVLERTGGFDESFTMAWREDSDLEFKLVESGVPIVTVPAARVVHPVRDAPWGVSLKEQKKSLFNALLYKKHPELFRRRIYRRPFWNYYAMIFGFLVFLSATLLHRPFIGGAAAGAWAILTLDFMRKRLQGTSHAPGHIAEMIFTSICIPFLSVFWTLYGSIRYKTFFL
ncbi:MAG TPA: glycosyltransferase [Puia sp.]|nr:glycosyltransferase [Puia sp.]